MPWIYFIPTGLAFVVPAVAVVFVGITGLPFSLVWWVAALIGANFLATKTRGKRIVLTVALMAACILLTWEGGLLMLPALVALFVIELIELIPGSSIRTPRHARH